MKKILVIFLILCVILIISIYMVYSYRAQIISSQKLNKEYEEYYNIQILGTELISIINKTIDTNNKNGIERDENKYYINNEENSIHIYVQFALGDEIKIAQMEDLEKGGSESFISVYSTASFKCTKIEYHEKTKNVKSLTFEEIVENN